MSEQNTAVAKVGTAGLKAILAQPAYSKRFEEILGKRAPQFVASIIGVASSMPPDTEPMTIVTSAMVAATLDLPIQKDLGFAWIIPYRNQGKMQAQFQMGHKGFIQLALRTGQYAGMNARAINKDAFGGYDAIGEPIIHWDKIDESLEIIGYAFAWKLVGGFTKVCYWTRKRVEEHAKRYSQAYAKGYNSPWKTHFDQMALKTVIKNELSDWGILSVEMRQAAKFDQGIVLDVESEIVQYPDNNQEQEVPRAEATPGPTAPAKMPFRREKKTEPAAPVQTEPSDNDGDLGPQKTPDNIVDVTATVQQQAPANPTQPAPAKDVPPAESKSSETTQASASTATAGASHAPAEKKVEKPKAVEVPPAKTPADWLPCLDNSDAKEVLKSINEWMKFEEITEEEILAWFMANKWAKPGQKLNELATAKLTGALRARERARADILQARIK